MNINRPIASLLVLLASCAVLASARAEPTVPPPATTVPNADHFNDRPEYRTSWEDYQTVMQGRAADLIFIGDSITQQWRWGQGKPVWEKHYATRALNFGQGGDQTQHVLWRLRHLDVRRYAPRIAVVMIGTNNLNDPPEDIAAGVKAVIATTREVFPGIKVVLVSILPSKRAFAKMNAVNALIRPICDERTVFYLDLAARFHRQGETWPDLQKDQLHLTQRGYAMWAEELDRLLARIE